MPIWIALIRGINVGGKNIVRMAELKKALLSVTGVRSVEYYIQSGNLVIDSDVRAKRKMAELVGNTLTDVFQIDTLVQILTFQNFKKIVSAIPFDVPPEDSKQLHVVFLQRPVGQLTTGKIEALIADGEQWRLTNHAFYFYAPNGVGRSKLLGKIDKTLGVPLTARNLRTVNKLMELCLQVKS